MRVATPALLLLAFALCPRPALASQSYDNCAGFIDVVPTTITTQGTWCLRKDVATAVTTGAAITINTNNVTIDCNDFKIGGLAAGIATQTAGVLALERINATVRNCNIRGFRYGVRLDGTNSGGHIVEDNRLEGNTYAGIFVSGDGSAVRRNQVRDTGGTPTNYANYGIRVNATVDVIDNAITGVQPKDGSNYPHGIFSSNNVGGSISGNRIRGLIAFPELGIAYGIAVGESSRVNIEGNHLTGDGFTFSTGLSCESEASRARGNIINNFGIPISYCSGTDNEIVEVPVVP